MKKRKKFISLFKGLILFVIICVVEYPTYSQIIGQVKRNDYEDSQVEKKISNFGQDRKVDIEKEDGSESSYNITKSEYEDIERNPYLITLLLDRVSCCKPERIGDGKYKCCDGTIIKLSGKIKEALDTYLNDPMN